MHIDLILNTDTAFWRRVAIALVVVAMDIEDGSVIVGSEEGKVMRIKIAAGQNQVYRLTGRISAVPKIL